MLDQRSVATRIFAVASALCSTFLVHDERALCQQANEVKAQTEQTGQRPAQPGPQSQGTAPANDASTVAGANSTKQSPTLCVRSYETALHNATTLDQLVPYFSKHYEQAFLNKLSRLERHNELIGLKSAYAFALGGRSRSAGDARNTIKRTDG